MNRPIQLFLICCVGLAMPSGSRAEVVFEATSAYHSIQVVDQNGTRTLSFDGSSETRMALQDPLKGHFEYTEYFHMPWLWNTQISNVLMIGLGGASVQRSYQHYYPRVRLETAEIDPLVRQVAKEYFQLRESPKNRVRVEDGRVHLRRSRTKFDLIIVDAYVENRYGSFIPYHLATGEFFQLASTRLTTNGMVAYNVIGTPDGWKSDIVGAIYRTMKTVFPEVYLFPARGSRNIVMVGVKSPEPLNRVQLQRRGDALVRSGRITLPTFKDRLRVLRTQPPLNVNRSRVLTDDFAPIDGLLTKGR